MELEINTTLLITQLLNFLLLFLAIVVPVAVVYWFMAQHEPPTAQIAVRRAEENSYIQLSTDDIHAIDLIDEREAVIRLRDDKKVRVNADDAEQLMQRLFQ